MIWLLIPSAAAQNALAPTGQSEVFDGCQLDERCDDYAQEVSENLVEGGFSFAHAPTAASALIGKGMGLQLEAHVGTATLAKRNELGASVETSPVVPRLVVTYHEGSYTYDDPYPQFAVSAHLLPPLAVQGTRVFTGGGTVSAAVPASRFLWIGGDVDYTYSRVSGELIGEPTGLDVDAVQVFLAQNPCASPCQDTSQQHALSPRVGLALEPIPQVFVYGRGGLLWLHQRVDLAVDGSRWGLRGTLPTMGAGAGFRAADRWQMSAGAEAAWKSAAVTTTHKAMVKLVFATSVRFGASRYWEADP